MARIKHIKKFLQVFRKSQKTPLVLVLIGLALIGLGLSINKFSQINKNPKFADSGSANEETVTVDIAGEVKKPGVYSLPIDTRLIQAIEAAGGFTQNADKAWISKSLNLAAKLNDGEKILIPSISQGGSGIVSSSPSQAGSKININTASKDQLDGLYGIGPVRAQKIIANRPYSSIEELLSKKVLGEATFEKIKDKISIY